ncbi:dihydrofolate reductase family protein [Lentzea sp. NPDC004789]
MNDLIVIEFVTLDGVAEDPDGSGGTAGGGWAFRHGPEAVKGDKFGLGPLFDTGVLVLGRTTWELFSRIFPNRTDEFATRMNAIPKLVASRSLTHVDGWANSSLIEGDLVAEVRRRKEHQDVIVTGSISVVDALVEHDLVDEYRLLVFPTTVGAGRRVPLPADLHLISVEQKGNGALLRSRRAA